MNNTNTMETTKPERTLHTVSRINLRYRYFQVKYIGAINFKPSRIKIVDVRRKTSKTLSFDHIWNTGDDQAANYLESIGISIDALALGNTDGETMLLTTNFETELK